MKSNWNSRQGTHEINPTLARLIRRQHGAVSSTQLGQHGLNERDIRSLVDRGVLTRLHLGVFTDRLTKPTALQTIMAGALAVGKPVAVARASAALVWGLQLPIPPIKVEVDIPRGRNARHAGIHAKTCTWFPEDQIVIENEIPTWRPGFTVVYLGDRLGIAQAESAFDQLVRERKCTAAEIAEIGHLIPESKRRLRNVAARLMNHCVDASKTESNLESKALRWIASAGLPAPVLQYQVDTDLKPFRLDLAYPEQLIAIELDGYAFHSGNAVFHLDRQRQNILTSLGWRFLRFTARTTKLEMITSIKAMLNHVL